MLGCGTGTRYEVVLSHDVGGGSGGAVGGNAEGRERR